jgi:RNA polymerase sigma-70 factor (ECF subfamily)
MEAFYLQIHQLRPALLRAARHRLRNPAWAEDAVSEALLAAIQHRPAFSEPARVRAWLFGVLRHKVLDQLRQHLKEDSQQVLNETAEGGPIEIGDPSPQADPVQRLASRQFISALNRQLARLPRTQARAFVMRECLGDETAQICGELDITPNNLWVVLHRTRHRLRQSLAEHRN